MPTTRSASNGKLAPCPPELRDRCSELSWTRLHLEAQRCIVLGASTETMHVLEWLCVGKVLSDAGARGHGGRFAFINPAEIVVTPEELLFLLAEAVPRGLLPPLGPETPRYSPAELLRRFAREEPRFPARYAAYRRFRWGKGYVIRAGTGFGVDLMLYKGSPDEVHASYGLWVVHAPPYEPPRMPDLRRKEAPWLPPDELLDAWNDALRESQDLQAQATGASEDGRAPGRKRRRGVSDDHRAPEQAAVSWSELQQVCRVMRSVKKSLLVAWLAEPVAMPPADEDSDEAWQAAYDSLCATEIQCVRFMGVSVTGKHGAEDEDEAKEAAGKHRNQPGVPASQQGRGPRLVLGEESAPAMAFHADEDNL